MTDSERAIEDHPNRPSSITLEKWKEIKDQMEYLNDRTWPYHGASPCAMKVRASVLNKFWRDHISDKYGFGGCMCGGPSQRCRRPPSLMRWQIWTRWKDGKKKNGWDRIWPHPCACGYIPRLLCAMDERDIHRVSSMNRTLRARLR